MSSGNERGRFIIWVPDLSSHTGWSGISVRPEKTRGDESPKRDKIGFRTPAVPSDVRSEVE